jgi:hypothetical protein
MPEQEFGQGWNPAPLDGPENAQARQTLAEWQGFRPTASFIQAAVKFIKVVPFVVAAGVVAGVYLASTGMIGGGQ